ncbi:hypothetical protein AGLY_005354 [Aphis glycines]|uniref:Uncharacterized protein n=1 Tax=Aphis glycines TaxID=307491 RepID=A0A6G0TWK2_APHGL|nr:hypothetical protein AGLY_005354 [Aphis glycines]
MLCAIWKSMRCSRIKAMNYLISIFLLNELNIIREKKENTKQNSWSIINRKEKKIILLIAIMFQLMIGGVRDLNCVKFKLWPRTCFLDSAFSFRHLNSGNSVLLCNWGFRDVQTLREHCEEFFKKLVFSFFLSGVKMIAGSINSKVLGGNLGFTGTDLGFSGNALELFCTTTLGFSASDLEPFGGNLEFLEGCLEFLGGLTFCFPFILFLTTQAFNSI